MDLSGLSGLCRVCAKNQCEMFDLFDEFSNELRLSEMFAFCIQSTITENDNRPNNICSDCVNNLKIAFDFHNLIKSSEELFKQMISADGIKSENPSVSVSNSDPILVNVDAIEMFDYKSELSESSRSYDNNGPLESPSKAKVFRKRKHRCFECHMCRWTTQNYNNLRTHMKEHKMATPNKCDICALWFSNAQFVNHLCRGKSVDCQYCSEQFDTTLTLLKHLNGHEKRNLHQCDQCTKQFSMAFLLECHKQQHNGIEKPFVCDICDARFRFNFILKKHIQSHSNERPHLCFECGSAFKTTSSLRNHVLRHSKIKAFACLQCPKSFHDKSGLKKHMDVHSDIKYICNSCGAVLSSRRSLDEHKRLRHRQAEERICEVCSMKFKTLYTLKRHLLTHTGERPYKCDQPNCDRRFTQSGDLNKHLRTHVGDKTYICECGARFRLQIELRKHSYQHFQESQKNPN